MCTEPDKKWHESKKEEGLIKTLDTMHKRNSIVNWQKHAQYAAKEIKDSDTATRGMMSDLKQKYKLGKLLGQGAYGKVYECTLKNATTD